MKSFILSFTITTMFYISAYTCIIDLSVHTSPVYKEYLISNTTSPRIIIDSGSNGAFGIHSRTIEEITSIPVINISDIAGIPLRLKIDRISQNIQENDILILPLEYHYYFEDNIDHNFLYGLWNGYGHYYRTLNNLDRCNFSVRNIPSSALLNPALSHIDRYTKSSNLLTDVSTRTLPLNYYLRNNLRENLHGDGIHSFDSVQEVGIQDFSELVLKSIDYKYHDLAISDTFLQQLNMLKDLQKRGVKVFFSWPVIVGDNEFHDETKDIRKIFQEISRILYENEFEILGNPQDFYFDRKHYGYDTPYHLNHDGSIQRSRKLARLLIKELPRVADYSNTPLSLQLNRLNSIENIQSSLSVKTISGNLELSTVDEIQKYFYMTFQSQIENSNLTLKYPALNCRFIKPQNTHILFSVNLKRTISSDLQLYINGKQIKSCKFFNDIVFLIDIRNLPLTNHLSLKFLPNSNDSFGIDHDHRIGSTTNNYTNIIRFIYRDFDDHMIQFIQNLYLENLHRLPDFHGFLNWLNQVESHNNYLKLKEDFIRSAMSEYLEPGK